MREPRCFSVFGTKKEGYPTCECSSKFKSLTSYIHAKPSANHLRDLNWREARRGEHLPQRLDKRSRDQTVMQAERSGWHAQVALDNMFPRGKRKLMNHHDAEYSDLKRSGCPLKPVKSSRHSFCHGKGRSLQKGGFL